MSGIIERVARAMCDGKWDAENFNETANGEEPYEQRAYWMEKAMTAIAAMRETDNAMDVAGVLWLRQSPYDASGSWEAMINEALK